VTLTSVEIQPRGMAYAVLRVHATNRGRLPVAVDAWYVQPRGWRNRARLPMRGGLSGSNVAFPYALAPGSGALAFDIDLHSLPATSYQEVWDGVTHVPVRVVLVLGNGKTGHQPMARPRDPREVAPAHEVHGDPNLVRNPQRKWWRKRSG
jgi:hypothetical protein